MRRRGLLRCAVAFGAIAAVTTMTAGPLGADPLGQITDVATGGVATGFTAGTGPAAITTGPDGNLWFLERETQSVARMTPDGVVTEFPTGLGPTASLADITSGPDGALWFTDFNPPGAIGRVTTDGTVTIVGTGGVTPGFTSGNVAGITTGPDGNLWVARPFSVPALIRITPGGTFTEFGVPEGLDATANLRDVVTGPDGALWTSDSSLPSTGGIGRMWRFDLATSTFSLLATAGTTPGFPAAATPDRLALGPDGNVWATMFGPAGVARFTAAGEVTEFTDGIGAEAFLQDIAAGCDAVWLTISTEDDSVASVARVTSDGAITIYTEGIALDSRPSGITQGPDGNMWFTNALDPGTVSRLGQGDCGAPAPPDPVVVIPTFTG